MSSSDLLLLTNNEYDRSKYRSVGIVTATHVEAISGLRSFGADIMGIFGNKSELLTKKMDDALRGVNTSLLSVAKGKYPNLAGICDIRYDTNTFATDENSTFITFQASGTALVLSASTGGGRTKNRKTRRNRK
jgi:uncharacterized protein YbjQ (UPF0145 family)